MKLQSAGYSTTMWNYGIDATQTRARNCNDTTCDLLAVDGTFLRSHAEIRQYYEDNLSGKYAGFQARSVEALGVRDLGAGVAVLDATWEVHASSASDVPSEPVAKPIGSFVLVESNNTWKISAARLMVPFKLSE